MKYDSTFPQAYAGLANVYWYKHSGQVYLSENYLDSVLILTDIVLSYDKQTVEAYIVGSKLYVNKNDIDKKISILIYAIYEKKLYYFPLKFVPLQYLDLGKKRRKSLPNELIQIKI